MGQIAWRAAASTIIAIGILIATPEPHGSAGSSSSSTVRQARMDCFPRDVYVPSVASNPDGRFGAFGAKQYCPIPQAQTVCVKVQEYYNDAWRDRNEFVCKSAPGVWSLAHNPTYTCESLGEGRFRTAARFVSLNSTKRKNSAGNRICEGY